MDEIEQIKQKIDLVDFISQHISLKRAGRNFKALCPFHQEKTPSFIVSPERQIWHCFGACNDGGDIFKFLMKWENIDFYSALKILAQKAGIKLEKFRVQSSEFREKEKIYEINHLASELYHYLLISHRVGQKALDYLKQRGISQASIKKFALGYAPDSWQTVLPFLKKKGYGEEEIEKAGLIIHATRYYDRFRGRIIFTLKDHRENVVGFSGRTLEPDLKGAKYINTPETPTYHKSDLLYGLDLAKKAIRQANEVIITEGEFDVISSFQTGIENIVAIKGSALTENQARLLKRFTENITLALDADLAGEEATRRGVETADQIGLFVKVIQLPKGEDADSLIRKKINHWQKIVKASMPIYDFFLNSAFNRFQAEKPQGKREIARELLPIWAKISDPILQAHYLKILAQKLKISEESLIIALDKLIKKPETKTEELIISNKGKSREEILEEYFFAIILKLKAIKKFLALFWEKDLITVFQSPAIKKVLTKLKEFLEEKRVEDYSSSEVETSTESRSSRQARTVTKFKIADFAKALPKELLPVLDQTYLKNIEESLKSEPAKEKEIIKVFRERKKLFLRRKLKNLATKIKEKGVKEEFRKASAELRSLEQIDKNTRMTLLP